jgi:ribonuclease G
MTKEMIISSNVHETIVAILEDDLVAEIFVERENQRGVVGNVYKGRVNKVLPGMQSSFIDVGLERDGFLYAADVIDTMASSTSSSRATRTAGQGAAPRQPAAAKIENRSARWQLIVRSS